MQNKGKLPVTGFITLESNEDNWRLLVKKLINELKTTAVLEREPGKKVRISLVIDFILPPDKMRTRSQCTSTTDLGKEISVGLSRTKEFFNDHINSKTWLFKGYIDGENHIPIFIVYYEIINTMIYTQKLATENDDHFFSKAMLN